MTGLKAPDRLENRMAAALFCALLAFHAWGASVGWNDLALFGCEFRQTQTAISAHFILQERNYSLAYPTPVLGKPWSIPMEFPLYQWTVAWLADKSGLNLTQSARTVSLACFYLALPALYLLLARLGLPRARRLVVLGMVLCCPLYIFYSRAFLIETMAWMFGCWFLLGYGLGVERRHGGWLAVAAVAGAASGLVKATTLITFLLPALIWTLVWFWQDWRQGDPGGRVARLLRRVGWCAAAVALPFAANIWWVHYADVVKAQSVAGDFLRSERLTAYNFGLGSRFDADLWRQHLKVLVTELAPVPVLIGAGIVALGFARHRAWLIGLLLFCFFAVQEIFPILYAWHEYYFVANAMFLMAAIGIGCCGLLESRLPRAVVWLVILALCAGEIRGYWVLHYAGQKVESPGGSELTAALRKVTGPDDVLIIAGNDWSSITPYFSQRRALMIRRNLEKTWDVINPAFHALRDETIGALILHGEQRTNQELINLALRTFPLDPRPAFTWRDTTVYLHRQLRSRELGKLAGAPGIVLPADAAQADGESYGHEIETASLLERYRGVFAQMSPEPWKYHATFGLVWIQVQDREFLFAHPDTHYWFKARAGQRSMSVELIMKPDAYDESLNPGDRTDGVEVVIAVVGADGSSRRVGGEMVDPRSNPADRSVCVIRAQFALPADADIKLSILPGPAGNYARDWALLGRVRIE